MTTDTTKFTNLLKTVGEIAERGNADELHSLFIELDNAADEVKRMEYNHRMSGGDYMGSKRLNALTAKLGRAAIKAMSMRDIAKCSRMGVLPTPGQWWADARI